jgi:uncharacterized protein YeaO (DUF488 family)/DNA-binding MarR family transcriptional regulator
MAEIRVRRIYEDPSPGDGTRILVDRVWPRGVSKAEAKLDEWAKDLAPSTGLRTWYGHDPAKFGEFRRRYLAELGAAGPRERLAAVHALAAKHPVTLLTATRDVDISQAAVLAELLRTGGDEAGDGEAGDGEAGDDEAGDAEAGDDEEGDPLNGHQPNRKDFEHLLAFRTSLRQFQRWSEEQARAAGLTHVQHQLLVAIKGHEGPEPPTVGDLSGYLLQRHHCTVELVNRAESAGLVRRAADDRDARVVRVRLTAKGDRILNELTPAHLVRLHGLAAVLDQLVASAEA